MFVLKSPLLHTQKNIGPSGARKQGSSHVVTCGDHLLEQAVKQQTFPEQQQQQQQQLIWRLAARSHKAKRTVKCRHGIYYNPTDPFTILEPCNQEINESCTAQKCRTADSKAVNYESVGRGGQFTLPGKIVHNSWSQNCFFVQRNCC